MTSRSKYIVGTESLNVGNIVKYFYGCTCRNGEVVKINSKSIIVVDENGESKTVKKDKIYQID